MAATRMVKSLMCKNFWQLSLLKNLANHSHKWLRNSKVEMKIMKVWIALLSLFTILPSVGSMASVVKRIDINAVLHKDGTAAIEERWLIDLDDSDAKTEWYVTHRSIDGIHIENLTVEGYVPGHSGLVPFETLSKWDIDASRKEKTGKCGLANHDQEVCWGFGDWGEHEYVVRYNLTNLVKSYDTNDGFNHCFVDMDCTVEQARIVITAADGILLSEANTRRWAFGYEGNIVFEGNSIVATPNGPLNKGKRMIVMLEFDKDMFQPASEANESWESRKQRALDGSDFLKDSADDDMGFWDWVLFGLVVLVALLGYFFVDFVVGLLLSLLWMLLCAAWWVVSLAPLRKWYKRKKLGIVKGNYFRDVEKDWTLVKNKMLIDDLSYFYGMSNQNVIGALLLKLMAKGDVTIVREEYKNEKKEMLKILHPLKEIDQNAKGDDRMASHVLKLLTMASGDDLVLQPNEFDNWCKRKSNKTDIQNFMKALEGKSDDEYNKKNAANLFGLKAFLQDFTLLNERSTMEVGLWDKYLVYAEFFGLADQVRKDMEKICPEYLKLSNITKSLDVSTSVNRGDLIYMFSDSIYTATTSAIERMAERSTSSSGFSNYSSIGGGGGFSGGGGGGGR